MTARMHAAHTAPRAGRTSSARSLHCTTAASTRQRKTRCAALRMCARARARACEHMQCRFMRRVTRPSCCMCACPHCMEWARTRAHVYIVHAHVWWRMGTNRPFGCPPAATISHRILQADSSLCTCLHACLHTGHTCTKMSVHMSVHVSTCVHAHMDVAG